MTIHLHDDVVRTGVVTELEVFHRGLKKNKKKYLLRISPEFSHFSWKKICVEDPISLFVKALILKKYCFWIWTILSSLILENLYFPLFASSHKDWSHFSQHYWAFYKNTVKRISFVLQLLRQKLTWSKDFDNYIQRLSFFFSFFMHCCICAIIIGIRMQWRPIIGPQCPKKSPAEKF